MNKNLYKIAIFSLIAAISFSSIFCCCLIDTAQATEPPPSCHQADHNQESSQSNDGCDCGLQFVAIQENAVPDRDVLPVAFLDSKHQISYQYYEAIPERAAHIQPIAYGTTPLHIQYSVLRI